MPLEPFKRSASLTFGVELELQLLNTTDFDLVPMASDLIRLAAREEHPGDIKPEMTQSMIEISTQVHTRHDQLLHELREVRDYLVSRGDRLNFAISGGGTHPFQHWHERRIYDRERFNFLSELYGYLAKQFTVFGQHVHIGCESGDQALWLLHALSRYVPHFIALSASSPYSQGVDTAFDSARLNSVFAFPLSGRAPFEISWRAFETEYFDQMAKLGVVNSMKDFYWDLRPKPEYGTIELRVCDTPLTIERAAALAGYLQALCAYLLREHPFEPAESDYLVYTFNRFQACRFGLDGVLVRPGTGERVAIRDDILDALSKLTSDADRLHAEAACKHLREKVLGFGNDSRWIRETYGVVGSMPALLEEQCKLWRLGD